MAEYVNNIIQRVEPNQNILLQGSIPCNKGYVYHREGSGILTLRGIVNNGGCFARYQVTANANIAVPSDGTAGPIAIALSINGEPIQTSRAIVTPADTATGDPPTTENFFNVTSTAVITVIKGCCLTVAVENVSEAPAGDPAPAILVQNANLTVTRIA